MFSTHSGGRTEIRSQTSVFKTAIIFSSYLHNDVMNLVSFKANICFTLHHLMEH